MDDNSPKRPGSRKRMIEKLQAEIRQLREQLAATRRAPQRILCQKK